MKRRESLKALALGAITATALPLLDACSTETKKEVKSADAGSDADA